MYANLNVVFIHARHLALLALLLGQSTTLFETQMSIY